MADFYQRIIEEAASGPRRPAGQISYKPKSALWKTLEFIDRPRMTISEMIQAAMAGEDIGEAALRGLRGKPLYGTLGEALFPAAAEPGFQAEDIPAFAVDILTDPTIWVGPGAVKAAGRPIAKGLLKVGAKALPTETKILRELSGPLGAAVRQLPREAKVKMIGEELKELGLSTKEAYKRVYRLTTKENRNMLRAYEDASKIVTELDEIPDQGLNVLQEGIRDLQANIRPDAQTSLNSLMRAAANRWAPAGKFIATFGGESGRKYAGLYKDALYNTDARLGPWVKRLQSLARMPGAKNEAIRQNARAVVEGLEAPKSKEAADIAESLKSMLDDFFREATDPIHNDGFGQGLMVYNPLTGEERTLAESFLEHYFPRRLPQDAFSSKGHEILRKRLAKRGWSQKRINEELNKLQSMQPKKVGHVEYARIGDSEIYEGDPLKVLPKYFHDVIYRQELGKQFGMNNQVLDALTEELIDAGIDRNWLQRLSQGIIGRNPYYDKIDSLMRKLGTFQAISKLGYATSVANMSQATNQIIRSGFTNFARSTSKYTGEKLGLAKEPTNYDMLTLSRRAWGDIMATAGHDPGSGIMGWLGDTYMRAIGFPLTERVGRHIGAFSGDLEVQSLARKIRSATTGAKERGRLLHEIGRKYNVTDAMIGPGGELSKDIISRSAWEAARNTMHAFDVMELPLAWQDPTWKMILQFKSFIYKQSEFMFNEAAMPAIQWFATNGAKGDIKPLLRAMASVPIMAEGVTHARDMMKSVPTRVVEMAKNYTQGKPLGKTKWDYKDPFWEDADPSWRVLSDCIYMGLFGIVGDMYESARMGRLTDWLAGPTIGDIVDVGQMVARGGQGFGEVATQMIPGAAGIPYGANILEAGGDFYTRLMREVARRKLQ